MNHRQRATDQEELNYITEQIKIINTRLNYLSANCQPLGIVQRTETYLLRRQKTNLIEKLPPLLDTFTFVPPYILDLIRGEEISSSIEGNLLFMVYWDSDNWRQEQIMTQTINLRKKHNFDQDPRNDNYSIKETINKIIIIYWTNISVGLMSNLHILMDLNDFHNFSYKKEVLDN